MGGLSWSAAFRRGLAVCGVRPWSSLVASERASCAGVGRGDSRLRIGSALGAALAGRWPWTASIVLGSTLPSVLAAAAVLIGEGRGLALLVVGFGLFWLYEHRQHQQDLPADYLALRRNLSLTVCVLLAMTAVALDNARMLS